MALALLDILIIISYLIITLLVGIYFSKNSPTNTESYFLAGRNMPWWLLGVSMVATTFSTDTPNLVTGTVRQNGVSGNWVWWAFLLSGMLTVFVYSKLWKRSGILTDIEFYELRYSGKAAAFLRGFRAIYLGLIFNVLVMGSVSLAAVKFGEIVLGVPGWITIVVGCTITLIYSALGGLKAVIITDFIQFILAMTGSLWAMFYLLDLEQISGLPNLMNHEIVISKVDFFPDFSNPNIWVPMFFVPLAVQWWASYYPGSEPGGGGYIVQRMLSAKDEKNALGATLLFNLFHYALRPWPWIIIALCSLVIYPELNDIKAAFPNININRLSHDIAYPAMLALLPQGLLGLVSASLIAAFMSTMSTQVNLGASYLVNDFYKRFIYPEACEAELVKVGRIFSIISISLGGGLGLLLTSANQAFNLLLMIGSGTGLIYILRWFWWRINAYTEIIAMMSSLFIAFYFNFINVEFDNWKKIIIGTLITTFIWILATYLTPPDNLGVLKNFAKKINPGGPGWKRVVGPNIIRDRYMENGIINMILGCISIYNLLFGLGKILYGSHFLGFLLVFISLCIGYILKNRLD